MLRGCLSGISPSCPSAVTQPYQMRDRVSEGPVTEPVTLEEAKAYLRITNDLEDDLLNSLIETAREMGEEWTRRKFITQTLEGFLDVVGIASSWWDGMIEGPNSILNTLRVIQLPWLPAQSVEEVATVSDEGVETVYPASNYIVDVTDKAMPGRIALKSTSTWPGNLQEIKSVKVTWKSGYGDAASDMPRSLRQAVLMMTSYLYYNRGACSAEDCVQKSGANCILRTYRDLYV